MLRDEHPKVRLDNGVLDMAVYLPDPERGFHRGVRFDWAGIIGMLRYEGHDYVAEWTPHDPLKNESVTGPVDEYRDGKDSACGGCGYEEAATGARWLKVGVGMLERMGEEPFDFMAQYVLCDSGRWTVESGDRWINMIHTIADEATGWGYRYSKRIELEADASRFRVLYELINTGSNSLDLLVYNHNFFRFDDVTIGPDYIVQFPFDITPSRPHRDRMRIDGREIGYVATMDEGRLTELSGFGDDVGDHTFSILNRKTGAGIRISGDRALAALNYWSIRTAICPEPYIKVTAGPGETDRWSRTYECFLATT